MSDKKAAERRAVAEYQKARKALAAYRCDSGDDPKCLRLNAAVIKAEKKLPWWKRL